MLYLNRFYVCTKRILSQKLYLFMLLLVLVLTVTYRFLPAKSKEAVIRGGLYFEEETELTKLLVQDLEANSPLYRFYVAESEEELIRDVKSGYAECGFAFPAGYFESYIKGKPDITGTQYYLESSTLSGAIGETLYSHLLQQIGSDILYEAVTDPEIRALLSQDVAQAMAGRDFINISSVVDGDYKPVSEEKKLTLPILELLILLVVLTVLLSQLIYITDAEEKRYITLSGAERVSLRFTMALAGLLPLLLFGTLSLLLTDGDANIPYFLLFTLIACPTGILLSCCTKKSISYLKMLPFIVLMTLVLLFIKSLTI